MKFELCPWEIGRTYRVPHFILVRTPYGDVLLYPSYHHDADSVAPNLAESDESEVYKWVIPAAHDFLFEHRIFADCTPCDQDTADRVYRWLCKHSNNWWRRQVTGLRYRFLRWFGGVVWDARDKLGEPIPIKYEAYYGANPAARRLRSMLPVVVVHPRTKRLTVHAPGT